MYSLQLFFHVFDDPFHILLRRSDPRNRRKIAAKPARKAGRKAVDWCLPGADIGLDGGRRIQTIFFQPLLQLGHRRLFRIGEHVQGPAPEVLGEIPAEVITLPCPPDAAGQ
jgi:hypothetical protein